MKQCKQCRKDKPTSEYYTSKRSKDRLRYECKTCSNKKAYNPEVKKRSDLKCKYGLGQEDYRKLIEGSSGFCGICGCSFDVVGKGAQVDHDHETGRVRGILCCECNFGLGKFKDNEEVLQKAIDYLKHNRKV